jgi:hypothetical protein
MWAFIPERSVEAFYEAILCRIARLDGKWIDAISIAPLV